MKVVHGMPHSPSPRGGRGSGDKQGMGERVTDAVRGKCLGRSVLRGLGSTFRAGHFLP